MGESTTSVWFDPTVIVEGQPPDEQKEVDACHLLPPALRDEWCPLLKYVEWALEHRPRLVFRNMPAPAQGRGGISYWTIGVVAAHDRMVPHHILALQGNDVTWCMWRQGVAAADGDPPLPEAYLCMTTAVPPAVVNAAVQAFGLDPQEALLTLGTLSIANRGSDRAEYQQAATVLRQLGIA